MRVRPGGAAPVCDDVEVTLSVSWKPATISAPASMPRAPWSTWQFVLSALAGLASAGVPLVLSLVYVLSFTVTVTPDAGFNVYTVGALASVVVVVGLCVGAIALAFSRTARAAGVGFLTGVAVVTLFASVFASVWL